MTTTEDARIDDVKARIAERDEARRAAVTASFASPEAEVAVLGSMMLDADAAKLIVRILTPAQFFDRARAEVYASALDVVELHGSCDTVTLAAELRARGIFERLGGYDYLSKIIAETPSAANAEIYARLVHRLAAQRALRESAESLRLAQTAEEAAQAVERVREASEAVSAAERGPDAVDGAPLDFADVAALPEPDEVPTLVDHLIARPSVAIVYGPPQSGKSWFVKNLCMDLIGGGGCAGGAEHLQIRPLVTKFGGAPDVVLWVYGSEDTPARVQSRQRTAWLHGPHGGKPAPRGRFFSVTPPAGMSMATAEGVRWLREQAEAVAATVIVLDTVGSLCGATLDVSKNEQVIPFMLHMQALRNGGGGRVVILLHHTRKAGTDPKAQAGGRADSIMGSGAWRAQADAMVLLDALDGETGGVVRLQSMKAKDIVCPTTKVRLTLESPSARFRVLEETEEPTPAAPQARPGRPQRDYAGVLLAALQQGRTVTLDGPEPLDLLDLSPGTWRNLRKRVQQELLDRGVCVVAGAFRLSPTEGV
jgi:hypothetical protein